MTRCTTMLLVLAAAAGIALPAAADPSALRSGVPVQALAPEGFERLGVDAPAGPGRPARVVFGRHGTPEVVFDVRVTGCVCSAGAMLDDWREALANPPPAVEGLGDRAFGSAAIHGFVRDNVFVVVRTLAPGLDARVLALAADAAIRVQPVGEVRAVAFAERRFDQGTAADPPVPLALPAGWLDARFEVEGPAYVRNTPSGRVFVRTGEGLVVVRAHGVDDRLRISPGY